MRKLMLTCKIANNYLKKIKVKINEYNKLIADKKCSKNKISMRNKNFMIYLSSFQIWNDFVSIISTFDI